jgi:hypothetical protein
MARAADAYTVQYRFESVAPSRGRAGALVGWDGSEVRLCPPVSFYQVPVPVQSAAASVVALACGLCVVGGFGWL